MKGARRIVFVKVFLTVCLILYPTNLQSFDIPIRKFLNEKDYLFRTCSMNLDCKLLAELGYYEARGETDRGIIAVMFVALNRKENNKWPNSIREVVEQKNQFSYKTDGSLRKGFTDKEQYVRVAIIAAKVLEGYVANPIGNAVFYHRYDISPKWSKKKRKVAKIGSHIFFE